MEAISEKGYSGHSNEGIIRFPVLAGYQVFIDKLCQQGVLSWDGLCRREKLKFSLVNDSLELLSTSQLSSLSASGQG